MKFHVVIERGDDTRTGGTYYEHLRDAEAKACRAFQQLEGALSFGWAVVILEDGREYSRYTVE